MQLAVAQVSNSRRGFHEKSVMFFSLKHREIESLRAISFLNALAQFGFSRNLHLLSRNFDRVARKKLLLFRQSPISLIRLVRFASKYSHIKENLRFLTKLFRISFQIKNGSLLFWFDFWKNISFCSCLSYISRQIQEKIK